MGYIFLAFHIRHDRSRRIYTHPHRAGLHSYELRDYVSVENCFELRRPFETGCRRYGHYRRLVDYLDTEVA